MTMLNFPTLSNSIGYAQTDHDSGNLGADVLLVGCLADRVLADRGVRSEPVLRLEAQSQSQSLILIDLLVF